MRNLLFLLVLFTSAAQAVDEKLQREWEARFKAADVDKSRSLNRDEAAAGLPKVLSRNFDKIDTDKNGGITPEELWAMHEREVAEREKRRAERVLVTP